MTSTTPADVLVVGAGLAGLIAARDLQARRRTVTVVEARDRVGGRTFSATFPGTRTIVDLGAEWISPRHTALIAELERHGLGLAPVPDSRVRLRVAGEVREGEQPLSAEERAGIDTIYAALEAEARSLAEQGVDAYRPSASFDRSYAALLDEHDVAGAARDVLTAAGYALMGTFPEEHSALALVREVAAFGGAAATFTHGLHRAEGGTDLLARRLAADLDVRLGHAVTAIEDDGVHVTATFADGSTLSASAVVLAVPLNVLADIALEPAPPSDVRELARQRHAGRAVKTWMRVDGVAPDEGMLSSTAPIEAYAVAADDGTTLLGAFHLHDDAGQVDGPLAEAHLRDVFPDITVHELLGHDWNADPWAKGTWLAARPGQWSLQHAFWQPAGRIVFAGGDVAREWAGWMEGAVRSGSDAAAQLNAVLATVQAT